MWIAHLDSFLLSYFSLCQVSSFWGPLHMPPKNNVIGQKLDPAKAARTRELRRNLTETEQLLWQRLRANRLGGWHSAASR